MGFNRFCFLPRPTFLFIDMSVGFAFRSTLYYIIEHRKSVINFPSRRLFHCVSRTWPCPNLYMVVVGALSFFASSFSRPDCVGGGMHVRPLTDASQFMYNVRVAERIAWLSARRGLALSTALLMMTERSLPSVPLLFGIRARLSVIVQLPLKSGLGLRLRPKLNASPVCDAQLRGGGIMAYAVYGAKLQKILRGYFLPHPV